MLIERYGLDATRFYLLREMSQGNDTVFTPEDFVNRVNFELANDLGNLLNRTVAMINKYFDSKVPTQADDLGINDVDSELESYVAKEMDAYHESFDKIALNQALDHVMAIVSRTNKYIDETTPWILAKDEESKPKLKSVMFHLAEVLRIVAHLLRPFMPHAPEKILAQLGIENEMNRQLVDLKWGQYPVNAEVIKKGIPIFPRLDVEEEVEYIKGLMSASNNDNYSVDEESWDPESIELVHDEIPSVEFDQFIQTELKVAEVIDVAPVKGSNKLLRFRLDAGDKGHRQILSGIAESYPNPKELIGKKLVIVANLKPRKMMGYISQGMILSSEVDGELVVVTVPEEAENGSLIG